MKEWEIRYLHHKACRDACLYMHDIDPPSNEEYGTLVNMAKDNLLPMICRTKIKGKKFHDRLNELGHDSAAFENCKCRHEKGTVK